MAAQSPIWLQVLCFAICIILAAAVESPNVQRLSGPRRYRPRSIQPSNTILEALASNSTIVSVASQLKGSKNNPETDWKNDVAALAKKSQSSETFTDLDLDFMSGGLVKTPNSVQWLVDLYDPLRWTKLPGRLSHECANQMGEFLDALWKGEPWAAKMSDASGRYSSQWHFGNGYWLGSSTLCRELNRTALLRPLEGFNDTSARYSRSSNDTIEMSTMPLGTNDTETTRNLSRSRVVTNDRVPFRVQFYVSRFFVRMPADIDNSDRQVFIGQCLPSTCELTSVESMMRASAERVQREGQGTHPATGPIIEFVTVRPVPSSGYKPKEDPRFHALAIASALAVLLMILSTIYEYRSGIAYGDGSGTCGKRKRHSTDCESSLSASNNNRGAEFDKNLEEHRRIAPLTEHQIHEKAVLGVKAPRPRRSILLSCLLAFSPRANGSKIISTDPASENSLTCLHGLRVLSLAWVIMVHTYLQVFSIAENRTLRTVTERNFLFQTISNATFSVDTFFCISGLLVTILFYRSMGATSNDKGSSGSSSKRFAVMVTYRFIRLTPSYLFVLGVNLVAMKYAMSTTVFSPHIIDHETCEKYWWRNVLYVNSLYPRKEMCMLWSWYMANDMQFYILGMILLLLSMRHFHASALGVGILTSVSWLTTFSVAYANDYRATIQEPFALFDELYDKPWLRAGPYFIGMMAGYLLYKTNCNIKISRVAKIGGWTSSALTMCLLVYGLYPEKLSVTVSSLYASLGHTAWACAIAFIVIQCCCGAAPIVNGLLSLRIMYPLSRLTYCAYLVHPMLMMLTSTRMDGALHLHNGMVLTIFFGNCVASYLVAFFVSLAFEAPVVNLLKLAISPKKRSR